MTTEQIPLTPEGYSRLKEELTKLRSVERPKVISDIAEARAHGDLKENAEYHAAKEKQGLVEARIAELEDKLSRANVIDFAGDTVDQVRFGARVTICDEETGEEKSYRIVGDLEADIASGKISLSSPIARALLGKRIDDLVSIRVPAGEKEYAIKGVSY